MHGQPALTHFLADTLMHIMKHAEPGACNVPPNKWATLTRFLPDSLMRKMKHAEAGACTVPLVATVGIPIMEPHLYMTLMRPVSMDESLL